MKSYRKFFAAVCAALFLSVTAFAADASPDGTWKWTQQRRGGGGQGSEVTLKLELKDGKLSGKLLPMQTPMGEMPEMPISDASFKDGVVAFSITRERDGNKFTSKYEGKLEGDTIKGSVERPNFREGGTRKDEWVATRAK